MYKLDRTFFKHQTAKEASSNYNYWKKQPYEERLRAAFYLNSVAFNFDFNNPPAMERNIFSARKRK